MKTQSKKTEKKQMRVSLNSQKESNEGTFQFVDNRPETRHIVQLQSIMEGSTVKQLQPIQKKENTTGLPDQLKSGIENLSGYAMDDVKVHYNSDKPAQLHAHAYAQGTDIHLGAGQEKHLPHEAWHVVQQKQGRVKPTLQLKGKVNVNDDAGLEKEADVMGAKASQFPHSMADVVSDNTSRNQNSNIKQTPVAQAHFSDLPSTMVKNIAIQHLTTFVQDIYGANLIKQAVLAEYIRKANTDVDEGTSEGFLQENGISVDQVDAYVAFGTIPKAEAVAVVGSGTTVDLPPMLPKPPVKPIRLKYTHDKIVREFMIGEQDPRTLDPYAEIPGLQRAVQLLLEKKTAYGITLDGISRPLVQELQDKIGRPAVSDSEKPSAARADPEFRDLWFKYKHDSFYDYMGELLAEAREDPSSKAAGIIKKLLADIDTSGPGKNNKHNRKLIHERIRVSAETAEGAEAGTGLDELFQTASTDEWIARSAGFVVGKAATSLYDGKEFDWLEAQRVIRLSTEFIYWANSISGVDISGHTGTVFRYKGTYETTGQATAHKMRDDIERKSSTPRNAVLRAIGTHLEATHRSADWLKRAKSKSAQAVNAAEITRCLDLMVKFNSAYRDAIKEFEEIFDSKSSEKMSVMASPLRKYGAPPSPKEGTSFEPLTMEIPQGRVLPIAMINIRIPWEAFNALLEQKGIDREFDPAPPKKDKKK